MGRGRGIASAALLATMLSAASASGANLQSYEAVYDIHLIRASETNGPRAAVGVLETRFTETCAGWETKTHTVMNLSFIVAEEATTNERFFTSFENKNGRDYNFAVLTVRNGKTIEAFKGVARLNARGGEATYELPPADDQKVGRTVRVPLPQGTLFPAAYYLDLLDKAEKGGPFYDRVIMNGSSSVGPRRMSIAIGPRVTGGSSDAPNLDSVLLAQPSWRMSQAAFNLFEKRDTPSTEVFQQLHHTGVTEYFDQTFRDFMIGGRLQRLSRIDPPVCGKK